MILTVRWWMNFMTAVGATQTENSNKKYNHDKC